MALAAGAALLVRPRAGSTRPNLLLITIDTMRADRLGAYGGQRGATATMDALARRGILFENAFTVAPVTLPAHATLLTGRLPPRHGIRGNSFYTLPESQTTLTDALKAHGYRTAAVVGAAVLDRRFGLNRGFDMYDDEMPRADPAVMIAERRADAVVSRALGWLEQDRAGAPFFLWAHLFDPHHPYEPPEPFRSRFLDAPYDGEIAYADRQVARLVSALDVAGVLDNTLVVVTSDHGESLGEHGEATHGVFLYDSTLRVPLIMAGPRVPAGVRVGGPPVSLVDMVPTLLELLGVPAPGPLDGQDLLARPSRAREFVYSETYLPRDFYNWSELLALRSSATKFIHAPVPELYHLADDPLERRNLAAEQPRAVSALSGIIEETVGESEEARRIAPDPEFARRLQSLGYVAGARRDPSPHSGSIGGRPDPKSRIHLVGQMDQALALARSGARERAITTLEAILRFDPANYLAAHTLGDLLFDIGRDTQAIDAYRSAMRGREFSYYHYRLGILHERQRDYVAAAEQFGRLVHLDPSAAEEVMERADALLERGVAAGAQAYLEQVASADVAAVDLELRLAQARLRAGRLHEADEGLARALSATPADARLRDARATVLNAIGIARADAGDLGGAAAAFSEAATLASDAFESLGNLGLTELRRGDSDAALEPLSRAVALRPSATNLINVLAELRFRRNELEAARDLLTRSLAQKSDQPRIVRALREVEARLGVR